MCSLVSGQVTLCLSFEINHFTRHHPSTVWYIIHVDVYCNVYIIVRRTPVPAPRPTASPIQTEEIPDSVKWACALCTYLNHPLIKICEMCETHRPNLQGNNNNTTLTAAAANPSLVRTSSCQHNSGCFCHAHLG